MQLHIEYAWITSQSFTAFHQQFKRFNREYPDAYSSLTLYLNSVLNVRAHQLQQHTIEICCKNDTIALSIELVKQIILYRR